MPGVVSLIVDLVMILFLGVGVATGLRLMRELGVLRANQADMERIIVSFNASVSRAESGIKGLKQAARSAGDDLEPLIERATNLRDELQYLIDSADQVASRLTENATRMKQSGSETNLSPLSAQTASESLAATATAASGTRAPRPPSDEQTSAEPRAMQIVRQVLAAAEKEQESEPADIPSRAERLRTQAAAGARSAAPAAAQRVEPETVTPSSAAERELLRALQNLK